MKRALVLMMAGAVGMTGCGAEETKWDAESSSHAAYATQVPLYPGTEIRDAMGSESWGDEPSSYSYGMTWWCDTKASRAELLAWYEAKLPGARRSTPYENAVELTVTPKGGKEGEDMGVLIEKDGEYRVFEHRKSKEIGAS